MKQQTLRELIKQAPAILASVALVLTAAKGCRQAETIEAMEVTQTNLVQQIKGMATVIEAASPDFE